MGSPRCPSKCPRLSPRKLSNQILALAPYWVSLSLLVRFKTFEWKGCELQQERKHPNGQIGNPCPPHPPLKPGHSFSTLTYFTTPSPPLAPSVPTKDWETFPFQWQDMMGQTMINGTLWFNEVIVSYLWCRGSSSEARMFDRQSGWDGES